jgi:hypothetical protein
MLRRDAQLVLGCLVVCALVGVVAAVQATSNHMTQLPLHSRFGCANCHAGATVTTITTTDLNPFGAAFNANGKIWNVTLAQLDSDGDGCKNGAELGDVNGNGEPDGHMTQESSNPGVAGDCDPANIDEQTWGELKSLFNNSK